jgi:hypothetical protein
MQQQKKAGKSANPEQRYGRTQNIRVLISTYLTDAREAQKGRSAVIR